MTKFTILLRTLATGMISDTEFQFDQHLNTTNLPDLCE